jgi:hypothetical protein
VGIGDAEQPAGIFLAQPFAQPVPCLFDIGDRGQPERFFQRQGAAVSIFLFRKNLGLGNSLIF